MIKFKTSKQKRRWDIQDDFSIMTGGRPTVRVGGAKDPRIQRVSPSDEKLKRDFLTARATAYAKRGERPPPSLAPATDKNLVSKSSYFSKENLRTSSDVIFPVPTSSSSFKSVQGLVKNFSKAVENPQCILKPVHQNSPNTPGYISESQFFKYQTNSGRQQQKFSTTVCSMNPKGSGKKVSSWKICSSMPMTRFDASLLQMEMDSYISSQRKSASPQILGKLMMPPTTPLRWIEPLVDISPTNKENMNPNIFENFLPLPVSNQVNINCSYGPSTAMASPYFLNSGNFQHLRGNYFDNYNNSNTNVTGSWADHSQLNAIPSMSPSNSMMQPSFQVGASAAAGSDNHRGESTFPTVPSSPLPIFELGRGNSVELFDNINNSNEVQNATKTGAENSPPKESQQQQQTEEKNGADSFSNLSHPSILPCGHIYLDPECFLNELWEESNGGSSGIYELSK